MDLKQPPFFMRLFVARNFLIAGIIGFLILALFAKNYSYFPFDLITTTTIQHFNPIWFDFLMRLLTNIGEPVPGMTMVFIVVVLMLFLKKRGEAFLTLFSSIGLSAIGWIIKHIIARPRPDPTLIHQLERFVKADSFPSGHVLLYLGLYGFLLIVVYTKLKKSLFRSSLVAILSLLIVLIGFSRIYVGAHWFSDVLGSYLIGFIWLYGIARLYRKVNI